MPRISKKKTIKRKLSKSHKEKIAMGLRKYHKSCKKSKSKSKSKTDTDIREFLAGIKTKSKSKKQK